MTPPSPRPPHRPPHRSTLARSLFDSFLWAALLPLALVGLGAVALTILEPPRAVGLLALAGLWVAAAVLAVVLTHRRAHRAATPLARLAAAIHGYRIGAGEPRSQRSELPQVVLEPDAPEEVAELTRGLSELTSGFEMTFGELQRALGIQESQNKELEQAAFYLEEMVRARTSDLEESEERYRRLVELSFGLITVHDSQGVVLSVNPAALESLGRSAEEVVGRSLGEVLAPEARRQFVAYLDRIASEGEVEGLMRVTTASGEERTWLYRNRLVKAQGRPAYVLGHALDVTERQRAEELLVRRALEDSLTGLSNRAAIEDRLRLGLDQAARRQSLFGLLLIDLDGFKEVNDSLGHAAGDEVLREVARRLGQSVRKSDTAGRWGGDEFVVLLPDLERPEDAERVTREILARLEKPIPVPVPAERVVIEVDVGASVGVALCPDHATSPEGLVAIADRAMYRAKARGRETGRSEVTMGEPEARLAPGPVPIVASAAVR